MQKPFDVTTIMDDLDETLKQEAHDTLRTRPLPSGVVRGTLNSLSGESTPSRSPNNQQTGAPVAEDAINPAHYRKHPSGIECIEVTRHMNFNTGNAIKYIWRYLDKGDPIENLKKAQWYLDDEIRRLEGKR